MPPLLFWPWPSLVHISQWRWKVGKVLSLISVNIYHSLHCSQGEFLEKLIVFRDDELRMNPESLATAQEEATLTKIRNFLNEQKVKLWEAPYYDTERKTPQEV